MLGYTVISDEKRLPTMEQQHRAEMKGAERNNVLSKNIMIRVRWGKESNLGCYYGCLVDHSGLWTIS